MTRSEHYCAGKAEGERLASRDLADGLGVQHDTERVLEEEASFMRVNISQRVFLVGARRGYRQVVRTFERGKWGT